MLIPVRCFSCGIVIADRWNKYKELVEEGKTVEEALDEVNSQDIVAVECTFLM